MSGTVAALIASTPWPSHEEQDSLFLAHLARKAKARSEAVAVDHRADYPVFFAKGEPDVNGIVRDLVRAGHIEPDTSIASVLPRYRITPEGRQRLKAPPSAGPTTPTRPPDALTGLSDKGTFEADFPELIAAAQQAGQPLALLMIDADHFKRVNDTHGHAKGDKVLRELAQRLQTVVGGKGTAYRWGGEEMAALLPNHSLYEALAVAERIRNSVATSPVAEVPVTVSIGVAVLPDHATDGASLFDAADAAVYDAKERGRDCVRHHDKPEPQPNAPPTPHVARKLPAPDHVSDEWVEAARLAHFRGEKTRCPKDQAILKAEEDSQIGKVGGVCFDCPLCGFHAEAEGAWEKT
jgi:diguanylate cyclase (GGDEF)-like protein